MKVAPSDLQSFTLTAAQDARLQGYIPQDESSVNLPLRVVDANRDGVLNAGDQVVDQDNKIVAPLTAYGAGLLLTGSAD